MYWVLSCYSLSTPAALQCHHLDTISAHLKPWAADRMFCPPIFTRELASGMVLWNKWNYVFADTMGKKPKKKCNLGKRLKGFLSMSFWRENFNGEAVRSWKELGELRKFLLYMSLYYFSNISFQFLVHLTIWLYEWR